MDEKLVQSARIEKFCPVTEMTMDPPGKRNDLRLGLSTGRENKKNGRGSVFYSIAYTSHYFLRLISGSIVSCLFFTLMFSKSESL